MRKILVLLLLTISVSSYAKPISIMAYNVENLFDTKHDPGTEDYTWLPLALKKQMPEAVAYCASMPAGQYKDECLTVDWTLEAYKQKLLNLADVITAFDSAGKGPDILFMEEVENIGVLQDLVRGGLAGLGYNQVALVEGDDTRGIDVGVISKYPIINVTHHSVYLNGKKMDTRGILQVTLNVLGKKVVVFGNHWPSQNNPSPERVVHGQLLSKLADETVADLIVAVGDFNTLSTETPNALAELTNFTDSEKMARSLNVPLNPGTHHFKNEWQSLDKIFVHNNSLITPSWKTFQIGVRPWMLGSDGGPLRYDRDSGKGYSDHLPVMIKVEMGARN